MQTNKEYVKCQHLSALTRNTGREECCRICVIKIVTVLYRIFREGIPVK